MFYVSELKKIIKRDLDIDTIVVECPMQVPSGRPKKCLVIYSKYKGYTEIKVIKHPDTIFTMVKNAMDDIYFEEPVIVLWDYMYSKDDKGFYIKDQRIAHMFITEGMKCINNCYNLGYLFNKQ